MLDVMPITHVPIFQNSWDKPCGTFVNIEVGRIDIPKENWAKAMQLVGVFHDYSTTTK